MKVLNYKQLQLADEFLNLVSNQVLEKTKFALPKNTFLDKSILYHCHSQQDSLENIDPKDMKEFTEQVLAKIIR